MKELFKRIFTFDKIEFWAATIIYALVSFELVNKLFQNTEYSAYAFNRELYKHYNVPYSFTKYYFIPQFINNAVLYCSFLLLNFYVVKSIVNKKQIVLNIILALLIYLAATTILGTTNTWLKGYMLQAHSETYVYRRIFTIEYVNGIRLMMLFGFYSVIKYIIQLSIKTFNISSPNLSLVTRECIVVVFLLFIWVVQKNQLRFGVILSEIVITGIVIYWISFKTIIPQILANKEDFKAYIIKVGYLLLILIAPVTIIAFMLLRRSIDPFLAIICTIGFNLFFTAPFTWFLYEYRENKHKELQGLKTALGQSSADLDFLRSQINPHFLFNALNTLYGTALQENADRTSEGIQKLGDMMRFMLHENNEDKIALNSEINYLQNYISLQTLRTQLSPDITIQTDIDDLSETTGETGTLKIAPMLLIPFVENAFKHGISLREPSHIKIMLRVNDGQLLFNVNNSIHPQQEKDPEKNKNGIGLDNVKQRLQLLYPGRHELVIYQNALEFYIHFTVTL
jgi:hypothetical protein